MIDEPLYIGDVCMGRPLRVGALVLGRWRVLALHAHGGGGGNAEVWRAVDERTGDLAAIKERTVPIELFSTMRAPAHDPELPRKRLVEAALDTLGIFRHERMVLEELRDCPHVAGVLAVDHENHYLVKEFVEEFSPRGLEAESRRYGFAPQMLQPTLVAVVGTLVAAWRVGRDARHLFEGGNILIGPRPRVVDICTIPTTTPTARWPTDGLYPNGGRAHADSTVRGAPALLAEVVLGVLGRGHRNFNWPGRPSPQHDGELFDRLAEASPWAYDAIVRYAQDDPEALLRAVEGTNRSRTRLPVFRTRGQWWVVGADDQAPGARDPS